MGIIRFPCPSCGQSLQVADDKAGRRIRCRACSAVSVVPSGNPPDSEPEDDEEDEEDAAPEAEGEDADEGEAQTKPSRRRARRPRERRGEEKEARGERRAAWRWVRLGLLLLLVAVGVEVLTWLVSIVARLLASRVMLSLYLNHFAAVLFVGVAVGLCVGAVRLTGYALCLRVPREHGARAAALAMLIAGAISALAGIGMTVVTARTATAGLALSDLFDPHNMERLDPAELNRRLAEQTDKLNRIIEEQKVVAFRLHLIAIPLTLVAYAHLIAVPLFFRAVARAVKAKDLEDSAEKLLWLNAGTIFAALVVQTLAMAPLHILMLLGLVGFVSSALALVQLVWTVMILVRLRQAIADKEG
jgi:hypothetical protein